METTNRLFKCAALAVVFAATSFSVQAGEVSLSRYDERSIVVRVSDLDLSNPTDAATLLSRINKAAVNACTYPGDFRVMQQGRERSECVQKSYSDTVAAIRNGRGIDVEAIAASNTRSRDLANADK